MKVSLTWLRDFVALPQGTQELVDLLTLAGIEVEAVHERGADIPNVVVAQILESVQHPNADRLSVCSVDAGNGQTVQIVCGAKNYRVGDKVPLALPGAVLPGDFKIKVGKLRGVESQGMMCSAKELGLGEGHEGLLILPPDAVVGRPLAELFPADVILDLEITPNRPDLLSHYGIAREIAALRSVPLEPAPFQRFHPEPVAGASLFIHDEEPCPFYSARRIRGIKVGPSPDWLRARLDAIGIRSINNVVDVTNYVMMEMGQPLHAFDEARLAGGVIHVRPAAAGESFDALDGKTYLLTPADLVIADARSVAAIAGVMGGEASGVTGATTDILLESALFNPQAVRRTSRRLGLASDSSYRFERGVDPGAVLAASYRATQLILQVAGGVTKYSDPHVTLQVEGGVAASGIETAGALPPPPRNVRLRPARCSALLGVEVPEARIDSILNGFGLRKVPVLSGDPLDQQTIWDIPSYRHDLTREVDLIEEVSRAFGIENIPGIVRSRPAPASYADAAHDFLMELRRRLVGQGFFEARTFSLVSERDAQSVSPKVVAIRNPLIEDQAVMRPSLLPGLLAALERNLRGGAKNVRLFEIGRVFAGGRDEKDLRDGEERVCLAGILTGDAMPASWCDGAPRKTGIFDLKGCLESLGFEEIGFAPDKIDGLLPALRIVGYCLHGKYQLQGRAVGFLGQLAPARLRALDCHAPVTVFEIDLSSIGISALPTRIAPIPRFPAVTRDMAVIADQALPHASIQQVISAAREPLLAGLELFDVFSDPEGIRVPAGQKSLAYSLTFRSPERTLTADEVNAAHARLKERLKAALSVSFRE